MTLPTNMRNGELRKVFFISGMGRSGTQWLAALMRESPNAFIQHEWWQFRYGALVPQHRAYVGLPRGAVLIDWTYQRLLDTKQAMDQAIRQGYTVYGECGNKTRYMIPELAATFEADCVMQLIRDGRDVVRSFYSRRTYTGNDLHDPIEPGPSDPYYLQWDRMDRFEKLCWLWQFTVHMMDNEPVRGALHFESLLESYGYFRQYVCEPCGLEIDKATWMRYTETRVDKSHMSFRLPHWRDWDEQRTVLFWNICGNMMQRFGYTEGRP
jgi:hypothetical protein